MDQTDNSYSRFNSTKMTMNKEKGSLSSHKVRVLLTGGFGNVGAAALQEFVQRGHDVTVFELENKYNQKKAKSFSDEIKVVWGNILQKKNIIDAIRDIDIVVHLAGIIPPGSEKNRDLCFKVNVDGTRNIVEAIKETGNTTKLIFISSASVMGPTQDKIPPINPYDPPNPTTNYTKSKVQAEQEIMKSGVKYCICRLGGVISLKPKFTLEAVSEVFNIKLDNRVEMILDLDVAAALANGVEKFMVDDELHGKILNLGGGKKNGFQVYGKDTVALVEKMGIGELNPKCFTKEDYLIDWMDTEESQSFLNFQNHKYEEAIEQFLSPFKILKPIIIFFSPVIRKTLEKKSPYCDLEQGVA